MVLWYRRYGGLVRFLILAVILVAAAGGGWWFYQSQQYRPAPGGVLNEGMVGQPQHINPLFASPNPVDEELSHLVFRGLLQYDSRQQLVGDLADSWTKSDDGKTYTVKLGHHSWQDGKPITADDIVFTVHLAQDSHYHGAWSKSFTDVEVKADNPTTVTFSLKDVYAPFGQSLTMGILPQHVLEGKSAEALANDPFNLKPVGSGILQFASLTPNRQQNGIQDMRFQLTAGYLQAIDFHFYSSIGAAITDYKLGRLQSLGSADGLELASLAHFPAKHEYTQTLLGQSYAVYFNQPNGQDMAKSLQGRQALAYGLPRDQVIKAVFDDYAAPLATVYSPSQPYFLDSAETYSYDLDKAKQTLTDSNVADPKLTLLVADKPEYQQLAKQLVQAWDKVGVRVKVMTKSSDEVATMVSSRQGWDAVLLGEQAGADPDRYTNWHSTQTPPTGLNITGEDNKRVDKALEDGRKATTLDDRKTAYDTFQTYLAKDEPAIWLYQPKYVYIVSDKVKGLTVGPLWDSQDRFRNLASWYINESRK